IVPPIFNSSMIVAGSPEHSPITFGPLVRNWLSFAVCSNISSPARALAVSLSIIRKERRANVGSTPNKDNCGGLKSRSPALFQPRLALSFMSLRRSAPIFSPCIHVADENIFASRPCFRRRVPASTNLPTYYSMQLHRPIRSNLCFSTREPRHSPGHVELVQGSLLVWSRFDQPNDTFSQRLD